MGGQQIPDKKTSETSGLTNQFDQAEAVLRATISAFDQTYVQAFSQGCFVQDDFESLRSFLHQAQKQRFNCSAIHGMLKDRSFENEKISELTSRMDALKSDVDSLSDRLNAFRLKLEAAEDQALENGLVKKIKVNQWVTEFAFDYRDIVQPLRVKIVACTQVFDKPVQDQIDCIQEAISKTTEGYQQIKQKWITDHNKNHPFVQKKEQEFLVDVAYAQQRLEQLHAFSTN